MTNKSAKTGFTLTKTYRSGVSLTFNQGFTLIELLVVVLIIGILAAVALPQYQKAVKKARGTEALTAVQALDKAMQVYYLDKRSYEGADDPEVFSIQMPTLKHFRYSFQGGCNPHVGTTDFRGVWSPSAKQASASLILYTQSSDPKDWHPQLVVKWDHGKSSVYCGSYECSEYFNCKLKFVQTGTGDHYECEF